jgi:cell division protein FtsA
MKDKQIVAIDVGSSNVVIAVGNVLEDQRVDILGIVSEPITGINAGRVENAETAGRAVRAAKERIETELGIKITEAYAGLSGDYIRCVQLTDYVYVQDELGNGSNQITERDLEALDRRMRSVKVPDDREEIIKLEAIRYTVDDKVVDVPVGAYGHVLAATYNFILCDRNMRDRLGQCLMKQGVKVKEFVPNAFISHLGVATDEDIEDGAVVIDLGGGVTDVSVVMGGKVRYIASIPIGADAINSDIRAYGIPANYVENLKRRYGSAMTELTADEKIVFQSARRSVPKSILRRNLATIIESRLREIAEWIRKEIKEADCGTRFTPIVLVTGGGAEMSNIEQLFARELGIGEVRAVYPEYGFTETMTDHIATSAYATVASLLLFGASHGSCSVAARTVTVTPQHDPVPPVTPKPPITSTPPVPPVTTVPPVTPAEPVDDTEDTEDTTIKIEPDPEPKKRSLFDRLKDNVKDKIVRAGEKFAGKDEDEFFED